MSNTMLKLEKESVRKPVNGLLTLPFQGGRFALDEDLNLVDSGFINNNPLDTLPVPLINPPVLELPSEELDYPTLIGNSIPLDEFNPEFHNTMEVGTVSRIGPDINVVGTGQPVWGSGNGLGTSSKLAQLSEFAHVYVSPDKPLNVAGESFTLGCTFFIDSSTEATVFALGTNSDPSVNSTTFRIYYDTTRTLFIETGGQRYEMLRPQARHERYSLFVTFDWDAELETHIVRLYHSGNRIHPAPSGGTVPVITYDDEVNIIIFGSDIASSNANSLGDLIYVGDLAWWRKAINGNIADFIHKRLSNKPFTVTDNGQQVPYNAGMKALHVSPMFYSPSGTPSYAVDNLILESGAGIVAQMPQAGGRLYYYENWNDLSNATAITLTNATLTDKITDLDNDNILCLGGSYGTMWSKYCVATINHADKTATESPVHDITAAFGYTAIVVSKINGSENVMGLGYKDSGNVHMFEFSMDENYAPIEIVKELDVEVIVNRGNIVRTQIEALTNLEGDWWLHGNGVYKTMHLINFATGEIFELGAHPLMYGQRTITGSLQYGRNLHVYKDWIVNASFRSQLQFVPWESDLANIEEVKANEHYYYAPQAEPVTTPPKLEGKIYVARPKTYYRDKSIPLKDLTYRLPIAEYPEMNIGYLYALGCKPINAHDLILKEADNFIPVYRQETWDKGTLTPDDFVWIGGSKQRDIKGYSPLTFVPELGYDMTNGVPIDPITLEPIHAGSYRKCIIKTRNMKGENVEVNLFDFIAYVHGKRDDIAYGPLDYNEFNYDPANVGDGVIVY